MKKVLALLLTGCIAFGMMGCGAKSEEVSSDDNKKETISIAYQYGLAYAPLIVCKENQLIEEKYKELTGKEVEIEWNQMSSGADINTGIASRSLDVGFMGVGPAISGIANGVGYKVFTNISGQEHGLMTNDENIKGLDDIVGSDSQIALVNIGSIQHIILARALVENGYDAHALDANLVAMKHPDGMNAVESDSISLHLTTNPYIYLERKNSSLHEIEEVKNSWSKDDSFILGVASQTLYDSNPELCKALCDAFEESIGFVNNDVETVAKITCELDGNSFEEEVELLKEGVYKSETTGIFDLATFMYENKFIDNKIESYFDMVFDNVKGN